MKNIVIITDCRDVASNEIHAVLQTHLDLYKSDARISPMVYAPNFSVSSGSFLVRLMAESYKPETTIFLVILNALETNRSARARIIGKTKNGFTFVGANTGTLGWLIQDFGIDSIYESSTEGLDGADFISFGGKFIHTPICAKIAAGVDLQKIGRPFDVDRLTLPHFLPGQILYIDNFGVAKFYGDFPKNLKEGDSFDLQINGGPISEAVFSKSMKNLPSGTCAIYPGSSLGLYELGVVRGSAQEVLGFNIDDIISIKR